MTIAKCGFLLGLTLTLCTSKVTAAEKDNAARSGSPRACKNADGPPIDRLTQVDVPANAPAIRVRILVDTTKLDAVVTLSSISGRQEANPPGVQPVAVVREGITADELNRLIKLQAVTTIEIMPPPVAGPEINRMTPRDVNSRHSHRVDEWMTDPALKEIRGASVRALIIDEGAVRGSHVEFRTNQTARSSTRVTAHTATTSEHSTHVAGDLGAFGWRPDAKGIAPAATIESDDWNDDLRKLLDYATNLPVVSISNHSYGLVCGWDHRQDGRWYWWGTDPSALEDSRFGKYTTN